MVGGRGSPDQAAARVWAYNDPQGYSRLIDLLVEVSIDYLDGQVRAGADALQIFDSWAGCLPDDQFEQWVILPTKRIVTELKRRHPHVPIIGFPRGAGATSGWYLQETKVEGLGCDTAMSLVRMRELAGIGAVVQGNLDPLLLLAGGAHLETRVKQLLDAMETVPFIFNLGHGIVPETPPENVARLVALVRGEGV
jgi:uroporphyrinogen decarboxylase